MAAAKLKLRKSTFASKITGDLRELNDESKESLLQQIK